MDRRVSHYESGLGACRGRRPTGRIKKSSRFDVNNKVFSVILNFSQSLRSMYAIGCSSPGMLAGWGVAVQWVVADSVSLILDTSTKGNEISFIYGRKFNSCSLAVNGLQEIVSLQSKFKFKRLLAEMKN
jgi:hypothetical protein